MCGFSGVVVSADAAAGVRRVLGNMLNTIRHRGPDGDGIWQDKNCPVGLGYVRLAIIDPERGIQPMLDAQQRFVIVFNGAIYNYLELRSELISRVYNCCNSNSRTITSVGHAGRPPLPLAPSCKWPSSVRAIDPKSTDCDNSDSGSFIRFRLA